MRLADCFTDARELSEYSERTACYLITPVEPRVADGRILLPFGLVIEVEATVDGVSSDGARTSASANAARAARPAARPAPPR